MSEVAVEQKYTPASTALDAILPLFFPTYRSVAKSISAPLHPAAVVVLCMLANADADGEGMHQFRMKIGLRFALDRDEANRVVEAGTEKAVKAGLAETYVDGEGSTMYRLTAEGKEMFVHLNSVFKDG
ncbi:hypothetical protein [Burkholderia cepacia]|uniref:hypothetical protein n=1 Tax=Burkholderia cepacia TaxID=292 RepID=UPI000758AB5F|nr:hypothetical protein [Burkholderia cepacia]